MLSSRKSAFRHVGRGLAAFLALLLVAGTGVAADGPIKVVAVMTVDDDGRLLNYPTTVFYDPVEEEIYLVNGGTGRVVVYGPDFFPGMSIGVGRGVEAPRGGVVLENGEVYLLQTRNVKSARPRITILNGAFFVEREIFLDEIPAAADVIPRQLAISRDGLIYVAGSSSRGVLVLDSEGNFLRRLQPRDLTSIPFVEDDPETVDLIDQPEEIATVVEAEEPVVNLADIPEEFRPRGGRQDRTSAAGDGLSPVRINNVTIDSSGKLYLLSAETSKVYVYGPDEMFLFSFGEKGGTPRHLSQPRAVAIDERRGLIYVVDYMRHSILAYNMRGEYLFEFGGRGVAPGWFNFPEDMTINKHGQLIVADLFNRRVQVLEIEYQEFTPAVRTQAEGTRLPTRSRPAPPAITEPAGQTEGTVESLAAPPEASAAEPLIEEPDAEDIREERIEEMIILDPSEL